MCCGVLCSSNFGTVAAQCALLPPFYLCEIDGNGHVLAGVEIDVPGDGLIGNKPRFILDSNHLAFFEPWNLQFYTARLRHGNS